MQNSSFPYNILLKWSKHTNFIVSMKYFLKIIFSVLSALVLTCINPFSAGTAFMLMQTGWIQASRQITRWLAWDPTRLLLSPLFPIKNKQNLKVFRSRRQYNLFLENYPAFKGLTTLPHLKVRKQLWPGLLYAMNYDYYWNSIKSLTSILHHHRPNRPFFTYNQSLLCVSCPSATEFSAILLFTSCLIKLKFSSIIGRF